MDSALKLAQVITEDYVLGGVSSWQYWIAVSKYNYRDGFIYIDEDTYSIQPTKRLWAMGNFSKFIRPGFLRVETICEAQKLSIMAAKDPQTDQLVVVVSNPEDREVWTELTLNGQTDPIRYDVWETSWQKDLKKTASNQVELSQVIPPQSIVTLVTQTTRQN